MTKYNDRTLHGLAGYRSCSECVDFIGQIPVRLEGLKSLVEASQPVVGFGPKTKFETAAP